VRVKPEIDDMMDSERLDIGKLLFGRLTEGRDPVVQLVPVINRVGIGHGTCPRGEHLTRGTGFAGPVIADHGGWKSLAVGFAPEAALNGRWRWRGMNSRCHAG
jgi:hypothetical protein